MQMVYNNFFDQYKKILDRHRQGKGEGIRCLTTIEKDNKDLVKIFLNIGAQIRHLRNLPPMNFVVDDKQFLATIHKMEGGKIMETLLVSNEPIYINHYNSIFEKLWKDGTDAVQRIRDIEDGTYLADIEVFHNASRAREVYLDLVKEATKEILFLFPSINAFSRQHKIGAIGLAVRAATERNVAVRILMPANNMIDKTLQNLDYHKIDIRHIKQMSGTKATILIVDRKESLVMELRDDSKTTFDEAIGLSTYSNSKAGVLSYVFIFENLWKQIELYEDIKKSHEELMALDKMKQEFINVAAHELRTPIQPILGMADILRSKEKDGGLEAEYLDVIIRNAKRLQRLTEDILDISRIESKSLDLKKESFNLNEMILNAIADSNNRVAKEHKDTNLKLEFIDSKEDIFIEADKGRINQVISNLLSNAIKFTNKGTISIISDAELTNNRIVVSITDTGPGIDSEILPRLFTKFATKSITGTGLGLFISKSIIDAHGGKIWGKNNYPEGRGATFGFSLPLHH
jgi:signal transduction histidine kinase